MDPFTVYGDLYKDIRKSMNDAIYGNQMEEVYEITKVHTYGPVHFQFTKLYAFYT